MADYLSFNTPRLKVLQTGPRGTHHMIFRFGLATSEANMITQSRAVCDQMKDLCLDGTAFESAELAAEGSEVFLPIAWGSPMVAATGAGVTAQDEYGRYVNFVGRSTAGSRVAYYLFNVKKDTGTANNRLTIAENAQVGNILDAIRDDAINLVAIDQNAFVMKSYANTGINDAVAKKSRALA
jgi:hypothetical protein